MEIIEQSKQFNKQELYKLTRGQSINMKDAIGTAFEPVGYIKYKEENSRGEMVEILAILSKEGSVYSTMSTTFKREFEYIWELMDDDPFTIAVIGGVTKSNRDYVSCTLA